MSIIIGSLEFEGPFEQITELRKEPGLYALFCEVNQEYELLELAESECVRDAVSVELNPRILRLLPKPCQGKVVAAAYYTGKQPASERELIRAGIAKEFEIADPETSVVVA
jgi:hypothetical protein